MILRGNDFAYVDAMKHSLREIEFTEVGDMQHTVNKLTPCENLRKLTISSDQTCDLDISGLKKLTHFRRIIEKYKNAWYFNFSDYIKTIGNGNKDSVIEFVHKKAE